MKPNAGRDAEALSGRKLELLKQMLSVTQQQLLLVNLDELAPLLERKESLIAEIKRIDQAMQGLGKDPLVERAVRSKRDEFARVIDAILTNERTMEARMEEEQARLRGELQALERQSRVKQYLEGARPQGRKVDIKR